MNSDRRIARTRTAAMPIGFRRLASPWMADLDATLCFAIENEFAGIDVGALPVGELKRILDAGLTIGTVDLPSPWSELVCDDAAHRARIASTYADYARGIYEQLGIARFFSIAIPRDFGRPRRENFDFAIDGFGRVANALGSTGVQIALEGWPGPGPQFPSLGCTPADCRALLKAINSPVIGINFDPSHLLRMNIDPLRFVDEFGSRIFHAHAKDTLIREDERYEHGTLQPPTFAEFKRWSGPGWRYAAPGQGNLPWKSLLQKLRAADYQGMLSIELEDENFNGSEAGERRGLLASRDFLMTA